MKRKTSFDDYYKSQIEQLPLYKKWGNIIQSEVINFFPNNKLVETTCPGCTKKISDIAFKKLGFTYRRCKACGSLFVSPRPTEKMLTKFYKNSRAMKFWRKNIITASLSARHVHQVSPIALWLISIIHRYFEGEKIQAIDYKPCVTTIWDAEELNRKLVRLSLAEPLLLEKRTQKNNRTENNLKTNKKSVDIITAFGVLEQEYDPKDTIKKIAKKCRRGGLFLLTTNTMNGFEYQLLGQYSHRIVPPYRLNLLTIEAIQNLLRREGFSLLDVATPGKLDVEIVAHTMKKNPHILSNDFIRYLFQHRDAKTLQSFQNFLQLSNMSSHLRIAAIKR